MALGLCICRRPSIFLDSDYPMWADESQFSGIFFFYIFRADLVIYLYIRRRLPVGSNAI